MAKRPASTSTLRIIAGEFGGRRLRFPDVKGLRPTGDRNRETLFNWLQPYVSDSRVLDLFAGSGALGFEAVSRGAAQLSLVEANALAVRQLRENVNLLGIDQKTDIFHGRAANWLTQNEESFDIVLLDPPFADNLLQQTIDGLEAGHCVTPGGHVYMERDVHQAMPVLPDNWQVIRDKQQGQVSFSLIQVDNG